MTPTQATTTTTDTTTPQGFGASEVQARPKIAITGTFTGVGICKPTASEEYEMLDLIFKPSRGSRKIFVRAMFRTEQFSPGFDPRIYKDYAKYPSLAKKREGKRMTVGETYAWMYNKDVFSAPKLDGKKQPIIDRRTGLMAVTSVSILMGFFGGTLEGFYDFKASTWGPACEKLQGRPAGAFGLPEFTADEIVEMLRDHRAAKGDTDELIAIIKQSHDIGGNLNDNYELDHFEGPLSQVSYDALVKRAEKSSSSSDIARQLKLGFTL